MGISNELDYKNVMNIGNYIRVFVLKLCLIENDPDGF